MAAYMEGCRNRNIFQKSLSTQLLLTYLYIYMLLFSYAFCEDCKIGEYDLSPLNLDTPWISSSNNETMYSISLCRGLSAPPSTSAPHCSVGTAVCAVHQGKTSAENTATSYGYVNSSTSYTSSPTDGDIRMMFLGDRCPGGTPVMRTTFLLFRCGHTLGSPVFLHAEDCEVYFEWESSVFCKDLLHAVKEIPCYIYDNNKKKRDLSPLIKNRGGYLVDSESGRLFYINVCRDITADDDTTACPSGSGGCRITKGKGESTGAPGAPLTLTSEGNLQLRYVSSETLPTCLDHPITTITFTCPKRGGSKDPILISDYDCHYNVEWQTEHACPESYLTSSTCKLTKENHDIDIDLTPLTLPPGQFYSVKVGDPLQYTYVINVCKEIGVPCPDNEHIHDVSACQLFVDPNSGHSIGRTDHMTLRYADNDLTLTYRHGDPCHTNFPRTTVIAFHCNETAGVGYPTYNSATNCTYVFDWDTKYACLEHPEDICRVDYNGRRYDLSTLTRDTGSNWLALNGHSMEATEEYYINVCHDLLTHPSTGCPADSSVCEKGTSNSRSLGKYTSNPTFDPVTSTISMIYTGGSDCGHNGQIETRISFICKPGDEESPPMLMQKSYDGCVYDFEWHTSAACALGRQMGSDCKVFDIGSGFNIDLSVLTKASGYYTANTTEYDYYINVCSAVTKPPCDQNSGVCQVKTDSTQRTVNCGQPRSEITYYDGMINLTYTNGTKYNSDPPHPRLSEIAFICDRDAGIGKPVYLDESKYTYTFRWNTIYACPSPPVECVVIDDKNHHQYDLSSLSRSETQDNWAIIDDTDPNNKKKYYLNICRPLNPVHVGKGCGVFASVCSTKFDHNQEKIDHTHLGQAVAGPSVESEGHLYMEFVSGLSCVDTDDSHRNYTTTLRLECKHGAISTGPRFLYKTGNCRLAFLWETEAACPISAASSALHSCSVKDSNSDFTFNLLPLMKPDGHFYEVKSKDNGRTFRLNVCGPISPDSCIKVSSNNSYACEVTGDSTTSLGYKQGALEIYGDGNLVLKYDGSRDDVTLQVVSTVITFSCNADVEIGEPKFVRQDGQSYHFSFETPLACPPQPVDCVVQDDHGNQYDLSRLTRVGSNWSVVDDRLGHKDLTYYINVCAPVGGGGVDSCKGPIGGCQIIRDGGAYNLGYIQGKPVARADGSLSIHYQGGSPCNVRTDSHARRSMRINFFCSTTEGSPSFAGESATCEYEFNWLTPSACPDKRVIGTDCAVVDPLYNYRFDLNPLKRLGDFNVSTDDFMYQLRICDHLMNGVGECTGSKGVGVCQIDTKAQTPTHRNAGLSNSRLIYDSGEITLVYTDGLGDCHHRYNRTTINRFLCDHSKKGSVDLTYIQEKADCTYVFEWKTALACPPYTQVECSLTGSDGQQYDLSELQLTDDNYYYADPLSPTRRYIINVCRSLVHQKGETCPFNAAACMIETTTNTSTKTFHNIGEISATPLKYQNGGLVLTYSNGELCKDGKTKSSTIISLRCNVDSLNSQPSAHYDVNGCEHHFIWMTHAACSRDDTGPNSEGGSCVATNPNSFYKFDLNSLKAQDNIPYTISDDKDHSYDLQVCGALPNSACGNNAGVCQHELGGEKRSWHGGNGNTMLQYADGVLTLNYTGGAKCHNDQYQRSSIINFVCRPGGGNGHPEYVDESDDCTYYFSWFTELACEAKIDCIAHNGSHTIDLSPLIKVSGYHLALSTLADRTDPGATYYINVCRPLNPIQGTMCPSGSGVCRVKGNNAPEGLGKMRSEPYIDEVSGKVTIKYTSYTICQHNPSKNVTSRVQFTCVAGSSVGGPRLEEITSDCEYIFEWETNVVCPESGPADLHHCTYTDTQHGATYDLSPLKSTVPKLVPSGSGDKYHVSVCGLVSDSHQSSCTAASVCLVSKNDEYSYGSVYKAKFEMNDGLLKLMYTHGHECPPNSGQNATSQILFECDPSSHNENPELLTRSTCHVVFLWKTSLVCPPVADKCSLVNLGDEYDLATLSRNTGYWNVTDSDGNLYWLNICQGLHGAPGCPNNAATCRKMKKDGKVDMLGTIASQDIRMSEDGKSLVLEYSHGDVACSENKRRSNGVAAKTRIRFICANTVGRPVFLPNSKNDAHCTFEFEWKSSVACKNERVEVYDNDGKITDPKSGGIIDLNRLNNGGNHFHVDTSGQIAYMYVFSLDGKLNLDIATPESAVCRDAVVCQEKSRDGKFHRNLGTWASRKYFMEDDILEGIFRSPEKCRGDNSKNVTTIIEFHCSPGITHSEPVFTFLSNDCVYLFNWETSVVCVQPNVDVVAAVNATGGPDSTSTGKHAANSKTVATIVTVFMTAIVVCVLLVVFHKKERRIIFVAGVKRVIFCRRRGGEYHYSQLLQDERVEDDTLLGISRRKDEYGTAGYHDDSDEDMLL